jgi:hypothetical protein
MKFRTSAALILELALLASCAKPPAPGASAPSQADVARSPSIPTVEGPLPDTATKGVLVWNPEALGYVAEEYFLSGKANVYEAVAMADAADVMKRDSVKDLARRDFQLTLLKADEPYKTRIVVYRPRDPARFSGQVIVEPFHVLGGGTGVVWNGINGFFASHGDAYVGVQHPATIPVLERADAERYGSLHTSDNTQLWDTLAQLGMLLKTGSSSSPLAGAAVKHLFMTGISFTGVATSTFANFHHDRARLADGRPLYDGYVSMENTTYDRAIDVPVIHLNTQGDFDSFGGLHNRRADGDSRGDQYRLYEVAGWPHVSARLRYPGPSAEPPKPLAAPAQVQGAATVATVASCMQTQFPKPSEPNDFPGVLFAAAAFRNIYDWVDGTAIPPRAPVIETNPDGSTRFDDLGNVQGGVRSPYVDAPIAKYGTGVGDCFLYGYKVPLPRARRKALHGGSRQYVAKVEAQVQRMLDERWILPTGAEEIVREAKAVAKF